MRFCFYCMSPIARETASTPSTLAISFFMEINPLFLTIRLYSSSRSGVCSSVNFNILPFCFKSIAAESPMLAMVNLPLWIKLRSRVDPALILYFLAICRNSSSSSLQTKIKSQLTVHQKMQIKYNLIRLKFMKSSVCLNIHVSDNFGYP